MGTSSGGDIEDARVASEGLVADGAEATVRDMSKDEV
jgi:hypothetical protein